MPDGSLAAAVRFHPIADLFPLMKGAEFEALAEDIRLNGLRHMIVEFEGAILDGRNRYRACQQAGVGVGFVPYEGNDPLGYVMSANLQRRHMNESQRAMVAASLANMSQGNFSKAANLPVSPIDQASASRMLGVSDRSLRSAKFVRENAIPEFAQRVEDGELAVSLVEKVAALPREWQQRMVNSDEAELRAATKKFRRSEREIELADATRRASESLGSKVYGVIYADPEWRFEPYSRETGMDRAADNHYQTSDLDVIKARKVPAADDCVLFLWATAPMLPHALEVMEAWGFEYKSHCVWYKDRIGTGYWFRSKHELLLVGTKGHPPAPAPGEQFESVIAAAVAAHSEKPDQFAEIIEELFPHCDLLEMNARRPRAGWDVWGNEAP